MESVGEKGDSKELVVNKDDFEVKNEKELAILIAKIIVDKTLKDAAKKGYSVPEIQS